MDLYKYIYIEVSYSENGTVTMDISPQGKNPLATFTIKLDTTYDEIYEWCIENDIIFNDFVNGVVYNDP